jgi:lysozyme family protein/peptidoglycan hydrolase-like protein with peptidoglycan-binding domain
MEATMLSFQSLKDEYERNWTNLQIRPADLDEARKEAHRLFQGKATYQQIQARTNVAWPFIGLCHYRESHFDFDTYLGNGQSLGRVTTIVPRGRGPFTGPNAFVDGAVDALRIQGLLGAADWSIPRILFRLEGFNGFGYHAKGVNSPYLYGGSNIYGPTEARGGKYVRDGVFDPNVVDTQLGTAVVLKALLELDPSIAADGVLVMAGSSTVSQPEDDLAETVLLVQQALNRHGANPRLVEDGINGPRTMAAISRFQQDSGLTDSGLPDAATIAALAQQPQPQPQPQPEPQVLVPVTDPMLPILQRLKAIENMIQSPANPTPPSNDPVDMIGRLLAIVQKVGAKPQVTPIAAAPPNVDQLKQVVDLINTIFGRGANPPLGQVNGALGETIGNLLNGKKAALGIGGALITSLLSSVTATPGAGGLAGLLGTVVTAVPGLSQFALPLSLAMAAWGFLGKMEKWAQGTAPPAKLTA